MLKGSYSPIPGALKILVIPPETAGRNIAGKEGWGPGCLGLGRPKAVLGLILGGGGALWAFPGEEAALAYPSNSCPRPWLQQPEHLSVFWPRAMSLLWQLLLLS